MIDYLYANKEWIFSGVGVATVSWLLFRNSRKTDMTQKSGNNSINIQVGGDLKVTEKEEQSGNN